MMTSDRQPKNQQFRVLNKNVYCTWYNKLTRTYVIVLINQKINLYNIMIYCSVNPLSLLSDTQGKDQVKSSFSRKK